VLSVSLRERTRWPPRSKLRRKLAKKSAKPAKKAAKRKPNAAFMRPVTPDAALSAVVGSTPLPDELTKKLWDISAERATGCEEHRMINAEMTRCVSSSAAVQGVDVRHDKL